MDDSAQGDEQIVLLDEQIALLQSEIRSLKAALAAAEKRAKHPWCDPSCVLCRGMGWIATGGECTCVEERLARIARDARALEREYIARQFEREAEEIMASQAEAKRGVDAQFRRAIRRRKYAHRVRTMRLA